MEVNVATLIRRLALLGVNREIIAKAAFVSVRYVDRVLENERMEAPAIEQGKDGTGSKGKTGDEG